MVAGGHRLDYPLPGLGVGSDRRPQESREAAIHLPFTPKGAKLLHIADNI
jgi:hypothetical protein